MIKYRFPTQAFLYYCSYNELKTPEPVSNMIVMMTIAEFGATHLILNIYHRLFCDRLMDREIDLLLTG